MENEISDILIGAPYPFTVGRKHYRLYPVTLAKMQIIQRLLDEIAIKKEHLYLDVNLEMIRIVKEKRRQCSRLLAYYTAPNSYKDLFDFRSLKIRENYFFEEMKEEDMATILLFMFTSDKTDTYMKSLGIESEMKRMQRVMKVKKKDKNSLSFGGRSIFGSFIAPLKEMGYTDEEILYERGYTYLRLMLADKIQTIYLSDDERKRVPRNALYGGEVLKASDMRTKELIKNTEWD